MTKDKQTETSVPAIENASLKQLALLFLKLGTIAFGGPAAHIAMMEDEVVRRRRWLSREDFLDLLGATNLIPGPNSTEMAIHIGHRKAGWAGLLVAGGCFILPAFCIVMGFARAYVKFGSLPQFSGILYGVKPIIIAIVIQALWSLGRTALKTKLLLAIGVFGVILSFLGINELLILLGGGLVACVWQWVVSKKSRPNLFSFLSASPLILILEITSATGAMASFGLWQLFLFFLKVGSVLYGSGYVLLAFLRADLVERWGWLSESQLLDAIAVGQVTPGPVFTTATFIGYLLSGPTGAFVATVGIFLPAFFFVAVSGPLIPRIRRSLMASAVLDGVNAASLALMAVVTYQLGRSALVDSITLILAAVSAILLLGFRINSMWLVLGGAIAGILLFGKT
jgi:chromate transporter